MCKKTQFRNMDVSRDLRRKSRKLSQITPNCPKLTGFGGFAAFWYFLAEFGQFFLVLFGRIWDEFCMVLVALARFAKSWQLLVLFASFPHFKTTKVAHV